MLAPPRAHRERLSPVPVEGNCWVSICTTMRVLDALMSDHGRMQTQRGYRQPSSRRRCSPSFASTSPGHQLPYPALDALRGPTGHVGAAVARDWACTRATPTGPRRDWTPSPGSAGRRRWCWRSAAEPAPRRWRWRKAEPHLDVVAVEVYRRGLAQLLSAIDREGVTNIRLVRGDGVDVLEHMFGPDSLTGVRVFFPDPWPKARHHKRRLLQPATVALDRRPAASRRCAARRHRPRRATPNRSPRSATPNRGCAASPHRTSLPISVAAARHQVRRQSRSTRAAPLPNCSGRNGRMSLTEDIRHHRRCSPAAGGAGRGTARVLLVWDAPNLDMGLGSILGGRPTAAHRPRFDALGRWLLARTAELSAAGAATDVHARARGDRLHQHRPWQRRRRPALGGGVA